jgi:uncharacterized membrane protein
MNPSAAMPAVAEEPDGPPLFDAVLQPRRSLPPAGFALLMGIVALVSIGNAVAFLTIGAWPVSGFCGLEMLLFYGLFRLNYRRARTFERVRLTDKALTVERHFHWGEVRRWSFQPYWLRVNLAEPPETDSPLTLSSHGRSLVVGSFLSPDERLDFARALRRALARQRGA